MGLPVSTLLSYIRDDVLRDVVSPYLFSDATLVALINDAYVQFARQTHAFVDTATLRLFDGRRDYSLPERTIFVRKMTTAAGRPLTDFTRRGAPLDARTGPPLAYTTDGKFRRTTIYPMPDARYDLTVSYAFIPEEVETSDDIELDHDHAYLLAEWVAFRALGNNDPDGSDTIDNRKFGDNWARGVRDAKLFFQRSMMGNDPSAQPRSWT